MNVALAPLTVADLDDLDDLLARAIDETPITRDHAAALADGLLRLRVGATSATRRSVLAARRVLAWTRRPTVLVEPATMTAIDMRHTLRYVRLRRAALARQSATTRATEGAC